MRRRALLGAVSGVAAVALATGAGVALSDGSSGSGAGSGAGSDKASGSASGKGSGSGSGKVSVSGGYIPQPLLTDEAAAYVTVANAGGGDAELTSVSTPLAAHVTLHSTTGTTMRQVTALTVPAGGTLTLGTGGDHMMLENLTHKPRVGETVTLRLHFAHATPATVTVTVPVEATTYRPDPKG
ncbi:copper chaperone PCu(A)C [Streptomyces sp. NPDC088197]|uniref:copper chaperone PCu(A)C n=1 Tax=unclassified Streptomyces TaxID=2593676 RepID=UPI0036EB37CA